MLYNRINMKSPFIFNSTGKFFAPSASWMHEKRKMKIFGLFLIVTGTLYIKINGEKYAVKEGQYVLIQPSDLNNTNDYTFVEGYKPSLCTYYWLHFDTDAYSFYRPDETEFIPTDHNIYLPTVASVSNTVLIIQYLRQLQNCVRQPYPNYIDYANYLTTLIMAELYRQFLSAYKRPPQNISIAPPSSDSPESDNKTKRIYNDMANYISYCISRNLKTSDVADEMGYSEKYLSLICKKNTGYTLKRYIMSQKIEHANFLLLDTNMSIESISSDLGFSSSQAFSRTYKTIMGISPLSYRNMYSKKIDNIH